MGFKVRVRGSRGEGCRVPGPELNQGICPRTGPEASCRSWSKLGHQNNEGEEQDEGEADVGTDAEPHDLRCCW